MWATYRCTEVSDPALASSSRVAWHCTTALFFPEHEEHIVQAVDKQNGPEAPVGEGEEDRRSRGGQDHMSRKHVLRQNHHRAEEHMNSRKTIENRKRILIFLSKKQWWGMTVLKGIREGATYGSFNGSNVRHWLYFILFKRAWSDGCQKQFV